MVHMERGATNRKRRPAPCPARHTAPRTHRTARRGSTRPSAAASQIHPAPSGSATAYASWRPAYIHNHMCAMSRDGGTAVHATRHAAQRRHCVMHCIRIGGGHADTRRTRTRVRVQYTYSCGDVGTARSPVQAKAQTPTLHLSTDYTFQGRTGGHRLSPSTAPTTFCPKGPDRCVRDWPLRPMLRPFLGRWQVGGTL